MWREQIRFGAVIGVGLLATMTALSAQQQQPSTTTVTENKKFEIIAVDGNHVVVKNEAGQNQELTVPDSYRLTVDGRQVSVAELKPGMKGTATVTTTTTVKPVYVTEVKSAKVFRATGSSIILTTPEGYRTVSAADAAARNATVYKDGQKVDFSSLHEGDVLTATIVTQKRPEILTERQVTAAISGAPAAAANAAASAARTTGGAVASGATAAGNATARAATSTANAATGAATSTPARTLPKTASAFPLLLAIGLVSLLFGIGLTMRRLLGSR